MHDTRKLIHLILSKRKLVISEKTGPDFDKNKIYIEGSDVFTTVIMNNAIF
jgi:hypothetical protein